MVYVDLNMVRAGVVSHPAQWDVCGFREIQSPPRRFRIIDFPALKELFGSADLTQLRQTHAEWVEDALKSIGPTRDTRWTQSLAVGSRVYVEQVKDELGISARYRTVMGDAALSCLREEGAAYGVRFSRETALLGDETTTVSKKNHKN
jgi:putative transposase